MGVYFSVSEDQNTKTLILIVRVLTILVKPSSFATSLLIFYYCWW